MKAEIISVIIITVLATLSVVALVFTGVVAFRKISKKADIIDLNSRSEELNRRIDDEIDTRIKAEDEIHQFIDERCRALESLIDSRCDKLYNEFIKGPVK